VNAANNSDAHPVATGVQALIDRLRAEGVDEGKAEAERLVADAESRAKWLVRQAEQEAKEILEKTRAEAENLRRGAEEAMHVAARDALLTVRAQLTQRFAGEVRRLVSEQMQREDVLKQMILEVVRRQSDLLPEDAECTVLLPSDAIGLDDLRRNMDELQEGKLTHFVLAVATDLMRKGITFGVADDDHAGLRVRLEKEELTLDISDQAVADLLLRHLQPRFRAVLEGIVK